MSLRRAGYCCGVKFLVVVLQTVGDPFFCVVYVFLRSGNTCVYFLWCFNSRWGQEVHVAVYYGCCGGMNSCMVLFTSALCCT